jgi:histidyl-tRNA synthetase
VYSFLDWDGWSGERVVLRPDSTIPAARLYCDQLRDEGTARLFYRQNVFRFSDDDARREEWQCGVELIGDTGTAGDVELVLLAMETLRAAGIDEVTVRLSHAGLVRAVLAAAGLQGEEQGAAYDRLLDDDITVVDEVERRLPDLDAPLRLMFDVPGQGSGYLANVRAALLPSIPALAGPLEELAFVVEALEASGVTPLIQAALARSFEYYSGTLFKIYAGPERICSGGRYDDLIGLVGGVSVPASGFALYVDSALKCVPLREADAAWRMSVVPDESTATIVAAAHAAAAILRDAGIECYVSRAFEAAEAQTLICRGNGQPFELRTAEGSRELVSIDAVLHALGLGR